MAEPLLSVREIEASDIERLIDYWLTADPDYLVGLGVDLAKMPSREQWRGMLSRQLDLPYREKPAYCIIWELDGEPVGHSNLNPVRYGEDANMHLHLWRGASRQKGLGTAFVRLTLPFYFHNFELQRLYCEPYALNPAPNRTMEKLGFEFVRTYTTVPGSINFEQPVNRWVLERAQFLALSPG
jgi:RimJ/RimL family protein N-acetyltransferase